MLLSVATICLSTPSRGTNAERVPKNCWKSRACLVLLMNNIHGAKLNWRSHAFSFPWSLATPYPLTAPHPNEYAWEERRCWGSEKGVGKVWAWEMAMDSSQDHKALPTIYIQYAAHALLSLRDQCRHPLPMKNWMQQGWRGLMKAFVCKLQLNTE